MTSRSPRSNGTLDRIAWPKPHARIARRLQGRVEALVELLPISHVAQLTGLHRHTIKQIYRPDTASSRAEMFAVW